jgi:hypothetical protein
LLLPPRLLAFVRRSLSQPLFPPLPLAGKTESVIPSASAKARATIVTLKPLTDRSENAVSWITQYP